MLRYILIILLSLLINFGFISNSHAIGGGVIKAIVNFFKAGSQTLKKGGDELIRKGTDEWGKIFGGSESSPIIRKGAESTTSTSKGANIGEIEQLAKQEKYSILKKIGKKNLFKKYYVHSTRVVKPDRKFLKDIAQEGGEEALQELTEEGFEEATEKGLEKLAKENNFYEWVHLNWIGRIYLRSEYYSKPKVEKRIFLVCKTENEIFSFSIIMEDEIKSASLIDHNLSNSSQTKLLEQELFVLKDLDEFKIMSTQPEEGYNYPKHYFTIFKDQKFIYNKVITGTENPGIIVSKAEQNSSTSNNKCYKATEKELL